MNRRMQLLLTIAIFTALGLMFVPQAHAARVELKVLGGPLGFSLNQQPQLAQVYVTGQDQETSGTLGLVDLREARGTGAGWRLMAQATDFIDLDQPTHIISAAGFNVSAPPVTTVAGNTAPQSFGGALDAPLELLKASEHTGMGRYQVEPPVKLTIPADVFAGTYESILTLTLLSGG